MDPNCFDTLIMIVFLKEYFEKVQYEKKSADDNKSMKNYTACKELIETYYYIIDFCDIYAGL